LQVGASAGWWLPVSPAWCRWDVPPAVYARLPEVQREESQTQGLDRLELIWFRQAAR